MKQEALMAVLYVLLMVMVCFLVFLNIYRIWSIHDARRRGRLSTKGKATMYDVRYLLMEGEKELATRVYCDIFNVTMARARKDVEELQRSLKV
ncbi:MAG: hypothetical protein HYZ86_03635 [Candidatus Omnitrophica bacterium]|nr:hypothetical protein [Candidatus Omnitrophota bacterium]